MANEERTIELCKKIGCIFYKTTEDGGRDLGFHCEASYTPYVCPKLTKYIEEESKNMELPYPFPFPSIRTSMKFTMDDAKRSNNNLNVSQHMGICKELNALYERKNHDYGDSFHETFEEEGTAMLRIRLSDKLSRFKKLTKETNQKVSDESIRDTLIDLANYAIIGVMELDRIDDKNRIQNLKEYGEGYIDTACDHISKENYIKKEEK